MPSNRIPRVRSLEEKRKRQNENIASLAWMVTLGAAIAFTAYLGIAMVIGAYPAFTVLGNFPIGW